MVFLVVKYGCDSWTIKKAEHWSIDVFELLKTLESPLDCKEIKSVSPKGNQFWIFIGRTDAETPMLWSPDVKSWLIGKDPDVEKDWGDEEKGMTEDEMVGWHHQLNGHEFEHTPGVDDGQGSLVCYRPWGHRQPDMTEQLNWTELKESFRFFPQLNLNPLPVHLAINSFLIILAESEELNLLLPA